MQRFYKKRTQMPVSAGELYDYLVAEHCGLTPPWDNVDIVSWKAAVKPCICPRRNSGGYSKGAKIRIGFQQGPSRALGC